MSLCFEIYVTSQCASQFVSDERRDIVGKKMIAVFSVINAFRLGSQQRRAIILY